MQSRSLSCSVINESPCSHCSNAGLHRKGNEQGIHEVLILWPKTSGILNIKESMMGMKSQVHTLTVDLAMAAKESKEFDILVVLRSALQMMLVKYCD